MLNANVSFNDDLGSMKTSSRLSNRLIAIYTVLMVLINMRERLGIEAMVDFLERYTRTIERINPDIKEAVNDELLDRALHGLYETVCGYEK